MQDDNEAAGADFFRQFVLPLLIIFPLPAFALFFFNGLRGSPDFGEAARLLASLAGLVLATSVGAIAVVASLVLLSLRSQRIQVLALNIGWSLLKLVCLVQVVGQGILVTALSFYCTVVWTDHYVPKLTFMVGAVALGAVVSLIASTFKRIEEEPALDGRRLERDQLGRLGDELAAISRAMDIGAPDNVVVGIDDNFFVTEHELHVGKGRCRGRTLFISLPLLRRLEKDEAKAVFAHEMAHFSGQDTEHGRRIGPLLRRFDAYLHALHGGFGMPVFYFMLFFRGLFELSLGRNSRLREFRADRIAAQLVSPRALATSLAKIASYSAYRAQVEGGLFNSANRLDELAIADRIERGFPDYIAKVDLRAEVYGSHATHPFDSHPSFADRLQAIGLEPSAIERDQLAAAPSRSWITDLTEADRIEGELWEAYESMFREVHEADRAWRLRPSGEEEIAVVRAAFPDRVVEGRKGEVLAVDYSGVSCSEWDARVAMDAIAELKLVDVIGGQQLHVYTTDKRTLKLPLKPFAKGDVDVVELIEAYFMRHRISREAPLVASPPPPKARPAGGGGPTTGFELGPGADGGPQPSATSDRPPASAPEPSGGSMAPAATTAPPVRPSTAGTARPAPALARAPVPVVATTAQPVGLVNGRYEIRDELDTWGAGEIQPAVDRENGQAVHCVRIGPGSAVDQALVDRIRTAGGLGVAAAVAPMRLVKSWPYRAHTEVSRLQDGDAILIYPDRGDPLLSAPQLTVRGAPGIGAVLRLLRPLAEAIDGCAAAGIALDGLRYQHLRHDQNGRTSLALVAPFMLTVDDQPVDDQLIVGSHPRCGDPATLMAALCCCLLTTAGDRPLQRNHDGRHRLIPTLPYAINQLLRRQLDPKGTNPVTGGADGLLDAVVAANRVAIEVYLDRDQLHRLRERDGLDNADIIGLIGAAVERQRPGVTLLYDQQPRRLADDEIDAAMRSLHQRDRDSIQQVSAQRVTLVLRVAGAILALGAILLWAFGNRASLALLQPVAGESTLMRTAWAKGGLINDDFPGSTLEYLPTGHDDLVFYVEFSNLSAGLLTLEVMGSDGTLLNRYDHPRRPSTGWAGAYLSLDGRAGLSAVRGRVLLSGRVLREETIPVDAPWFGSFLRALLTAIVIAATLEVAARLVVPRLVVWRSAEGDALRAQPADGTQL